MRKEKVIQKLRENMEQVKSFGVKKIGIFGSVARGEATKESDIDVIVEFEKGKATFVNVCGLIDFLEGLFGREIDLITPDGVENIRLKHVKESIEKEIEWVQT